MGPALGPVKTESGRSGNHRSDRLSAGGQQRLARVGGIAYVLLLARWNRRVNKAAWVRLLKYSRLHDLAFLHPDVLLHGSRRHTGGKVGVRVAFLRRTL